MQKQLRLFAAAALMLGGVAASAAELPMSGSAELFLRNVATGTYLKGDAYFGTKVVVWNDPYAVTLNYVSDGVYTIKTQQNNGGDSQYVGGGEDPFVDQAAANMTFTEVDADKHYYTITSAAGNLYAVEQVEDGATLYKVMAGNVSTDYAKWQLVSRDELVAALSEATATNPVDATFFLADAGIDVKSVNASKWTATNVTLGGGGNAGHSAESFSSANFEMKQTATGLPNGKYKVVCYGYYRWNNSTANNNAAAVAAHANSTEVLNAIFFAGDKEVPLMSVAGDADAMAFCQTMGWADNTPNNQWQAAACFTKGFYQNVIENVMVTDGKLTLGVKKTTQAGTDWAVFDEFKIFYMGEDLADYAEPLSNAQAAALAVDQEAVMSASVLAALQAAINNYGAKAFGDFSNVTAIKEAINALNSAASEATNSIAAYAEALAVLTAADGLDAVGQAAYKGNDAIKSLQAAYDARTFGAFDAAQREACDEALRTAAKAQTTAGADMTLAIKNWDFVGCANENFPGWTIEAPNGGNRWVHGNTCVEYWIGSAANGAFDYYQTVTGLPTGTYTLSASMWNSANGEANAAVNGTAGVYGTSGSYTVFKGVDVESGDANLVTMATDNIEVADGTLRLGVKNNGTMGARWFGVDWIKLTFVNNVVTGIENVSRQDSQTERTVFTLSGQRVEKAAKGLYIINGKKVVVK